MLREGVRVVSQAAAWARRLLPGALDSVDLGGDREETEEEQREREAAARHKLKEFQEQRRVQLEQQKEREREAAEREKEAGRAALRSRIDSLVRERAEARRTAHAKAEVALNKVCVRPCVRARVCARARARARVCVCACACVCVCDDCVCVQAGEGSSPYSFEDLASAGGYIGQQWAVESVRPSIENRLHGFDRRKQALVLVFTG